MRTKVLIFGTSTFAEVVTYYLEKSEQYQIVAFVATNSESQEFLGRPVVDFEDVVNKYPPKDHEMFIAVGY